MLLIKFNLPQQAQANVVGFLASLLALALSWIPKNKFDLQTALMLASSSVTTAALASLILGEPLHAASWCLTRT